MKTLIFGLCLAVFVSMVSLGNGQCIPDIFFPATLVQNISINPIIFEDSFFTDLKLCEGVQTDAFFTIISPVDGIYKVHLVYPPNPFHDLDILLFDEFGGNPFNSLGDQRAGDPFFEEMMAINVFAFQTFSMQINNFNGVFASDNDGYSLRTIFQPGKFACFLDPFQDTNQLGGPPGILTFNSTPVDVNMCLGVPKQYRVDLSAAGFPKFLELIFVEDGITNFFVTITVGANLLPQQNSTVSPFRIPIEVTSNSVVLITVEGMVARAWSANYSIRVFENPPPAPFVPIVEPEESNILAIAVGIPIALVAVLTIAVLIAIVVLRQKGYIGSHNRPPPTYVEDPAPSTSPKPSTLPISGNQPRGTITVAQANADPSSIPAPDRQLTKYEIDYREIEDLTALGKGSFGVVFRGKWREIDVAVKQLHANLIDDEKALADFRGEAEILCSLRSHPNVILFLGITSPPQPTTIVTEFCSNGSMYRLIKSDMKIPVELQFKLLNGIARGMHHLHQENIIHRDLAARNILLTENFDAKVTDFGMSRQKMDTTSDAQKTKSDVGPLKWMAPEAIKERTYSTKSDVYSFSITMWELLAREEPYAAMDSVSAGMKVVYEGLRPPLPSSADPSLLKIMKKCWEALPDNRPSFKEICSQIQTVTKDLGIAAFDVGMSVSVGSAQDKSSGNNSSTGKPNYNPLALKDGKVEEPQTPNHYGSSPVPSPKPFTGAKVDNTYSMLPGSSKNLTTQQQPQP